ncbi:LLM class flavin-dependent oxidoreductase [Paenibacillus gallinarum]|uniref:LLM class flavin-dependent oxidoreductase n=1 Tax=Paenibacillus gallinarum TaxID=2762232 RepID=A0ABR8T0J3_9BACL|nr:LLM class flavin-dependent oxidoreductase [Paenibacillus gallinarum]MBD7969150.1 LLM class flavin-dependent oxidoreductase [Paenibacillus gallinarum]
MGQRNEQMHLGAFIYYTGHHHAGWRHPDSGVEQLFDIEMYKKIAQTAERGKFDMMFFADLLYVRQVEYAASGMLDPITLLSALSMVTERIGLTATVSTTYNEPYNVARKFASLDYISGGRAGWNIVTSQLDIEAHNYGRPEHPEHGLRYEMASEFAGAVTSLWDTWEDGALVLDRENGKFADGSKVKEADFKGKFYSTKGPLNVPRPPQGYPVLIQAGSSEPGQEFAAQYGEVIFTAQQSIKAAQRFYQQLNEKLVQSGRKKGTLKIMPGLSPILGATEEEAQRKYQELQDLIPVETAVMALSGFLNYDLSGYPAEGPLPTDIPDPVAASNGMKSRVKLFLEMAYEDKLSILDLGRKILSSRGHMQFVGTPEQLADLMEEWFDSYACDGFNIMPPVLPGDLEDFVNLAIPVLQKRGLFREEYTGSTLREHLGLERPELGHFKPKPELSVGVN